MDVQEAGILIIDLDKLSRIMSYENFYSSNSWQNDDVPDTTETTFTTEDHRYKKYRVSISSKSVMIQQECLLPNINEDNENSQNEQWDKTIYNYRFRKNMLTRKNKRSPGA